MFMQSVKVQATAMLALSLACALPAFAADGDFDPDFGTGGIAYLTPDLVDAQEIQPFASVVLPDGKILFGGSLDAPTTVPFEQEYRVMFARFNADGSVDTTFGNSTIPGVVKLDNLVPPNRMEGVEGMQVLDDGSIVATGTSMVNSPLQGFVIKLDSSGTLDAGFGTGGVVLVPATHLHAVVVDSQGRIVVAGEQIASGVYTSNVLRFDATGAPDAGFGDNGVVALDWDGLGNSGYLNDMLLDADDSVIVGGGYEVYGSGLGSDFAIAKLDATGAPDAGFGDQGQRVFHDPSSDSFINSILRLAATPDGGIAFAGYDYDLDLSVTELIMGHLGADGSTDDAFGDAATPGYLRPAVSASAQSVNATDLVVQPDGKLLASAAYYAFPDKENFFALRTTANGQLDDTFAEGGVFVADLAPDPGVYSEAETIVLQPDGKIVIAGRAQRSDQFLVDLAVVRLLNGGGDPNDVIFADGFDP
jgi:uncharacterized delta-60 repeat protein